MFKRLLPILFLTSSLFAQDATQPPGVAGTNILYVSPLGKDSNAERGKIHRAWFSISNAVAAATNGETVMIMPGVYTNDNKRRFRASGASGTWINIWAKTNFNLIGVGNPTIYDAYYTNTCVSVSRSSGVTIKGIRFQGINSNFNHSIDYPIHGALEYGTATEYLTVEECQFLDGQNFAVLDSSDVPSTNGIVVRNNYFRNYGNISSQIGWDGGAFAGVGIFENNITDGCSRSCEFWAMPFGGNSGAGTTMCVARNNTIWNCMYQGICDGSSRTVRSVLVSGNFIHQDASFLRGGPGTPLAGSPSSSLINFGLMTNVVIVNNYLVGATNIGILVYSATNATISGNTITIDRGRGPITGISITTTKNAMITGNHGIGIRSGLIDVVNSTDFYIFNNTSTLHPASGRLLSLSLLTNSVIAMNSAQGDSGSYIIWGLGVSSGVKVGRNYSFGPTTRYYDNGTPANTNFTFEANEAP